MSLCFNRHKYLKDEAILIQALAHVAHRGSLYTMVTIPHNEIRVSVVNILCSASNVMPLEDALKLIACINYASAFFK